MGQLQACASTPINLVDERQRIANEANAVVANVPGKYASISEALAAVQSPATIEVGSGRYEVTHSDLTSGTYRIRGAGKDRTELVARGPVVSLGRGVSLMLENLTLTDTVRRNALAISARTGCESLVLDNVRVQGFAGVIEADHCTVFIHRSVLTGLGEFSHESLVEVTVGSVTANESVFQDGGTGLSVRGYNFGHDDDLSFHVDVHGCVFERFSRAGLNAHGTGDLKLDGSFLASNGIGIFLDSARTDRNRIDAAITRSVFYRNRGDAIRAHDHAQHVRVEHSVLVENTGAGLSAVESPRFEVKSTLSWKNAEGAVSGLATVSGLIDSDPLFIDDDHGNYSLQDSSPAKRYGLQVPPSAGVYTLEQSDSHESKRLPKHEGAAQPAVHKHALVIGVQDYRNVRPLKYARADAEAVADFLRHHDYEDLTLITDKTQPSAMLPEVKGALLKLTKVPAQDVVLIYFSGHGSDKPNPLGSGRGFLLLSEAHEDRIESTALPLEVIRNAIRHMQAHRVTLILDTCFAGTGADYEAKSLGSLAAGKAGDVSLTSELTTGQGKIGMYSSRDNEESRELDNLKHGIFTFYLLRAWQQAADLSSVFRFVSNAMSTIAPHQHPRLSAYEAEGDVPTY